MKTSLNFTAYLIYLPVVIALTWYVAHTLFKNSKIFMLDIFNGRAEISDSRSMLEILSTKIGGFSIYLGIMLFFNLYLFFRGKRVARQKARLAEAAKIIG